MKGLAKLGIFVLWNAPSNKRAKMVLGKVPFDYTRKKIGTSLYASP
jgi:hypothetical protein